MDDLSWILADGESLDDALEDSAEDIGWDDVLKDCRDLYEVSKLQEQSHVFTAEESEKITEALCAWIDEEGEEI